MTQHHAYYNEIDPYAADWLENLIRAGHIAPGVVDRRSIVDVAPSDLAGFTQCHFFAGVGVWSLALRQAGWRDDRRIWTGSCPCQPFSAAGKGAGFDDERHLWPAWHYLIEQCRPPVVIGEQVASADALVWWDLVQADLEATDYSAGAADLCAAGVGAPHIRQRLWWVAYHGSRRREVAHQHGGGGGGSSDAKRQASEFGVCGVLGELAYADGGHSGAERQQRSGQQRQQPQDSDAGELAYGGGARLEGRPRAERADECPAGSCGLVGVLEHAESGRAAASQQSRQLHGVEQTGTGGFWANAEWIPCRDGKWRPVEPGTFPLAHGAPARVGRLRAYGNAIVAPLAAEWVRVVMECMP